MKIIFSNWHDARIAIEQVKVESTRWPARPMLYLCQEGAFRNPTYNAEGNRIYNGYTSGTGRWIITDDILLRDRCALNWAPRTLTKD